MGMEASLVMWPRYLHTHLVPPSYKRFLIGEAVSEMSEYYDDTHVYCIGVGGRSAPEVHFHRIINIQSYCLFPARVSL